MTRFTNCISSESVKDFQINTMSYKQDNKSQSCCMYRSETPELQVCPALLRLKEKIQILHSCIFKNSCENINVYIIRLIKLLVPV